MTWSLLSARMGSLQLALPPLYRSKCLPPSFSNSTKLYLVNMLSYQPLHISADMQFTTQLRAQALPLCAEIPPSDHILMWMVTCQLRKMLTRVPIRINLRRKLTYTSEWINLVTMMHKLCRHCPQDQAEPEIVQFTIGPPLQQPDGTYHSQVRITLLSYT